MTAADGRVTAWTVLTGRKSPARRALDLYPTPPGCFEALAPYLAESKFKVYCPAVGPGALARAVEAAGHSVVGASDIAPHGGGDWPFAQVDFFDPAAERIVAQSGANAIIENPPWGCFDVFARRCCELRARHDLRLVALLAPLSVTSTDWGRRLIGDTRPMAIMPLAFRPDWLGQGGSPLGAQWILWSDWASSCSIACFGRFEGVMTYILPRPGVDRKNPTNKKPRRALQRTAGA